MTKVSYSQYSMYSSCPQQYKLNYIDKVGTNESNIHFVFGTSMHEVIQHFLEVMYSKSKKEALGLDLKTMLLGRMTENFTLERDKQNGKAPCTQEELKEFFTDGVAILEYFTKKIDTLYTKTGYELLGIEHEIKREIQPGVEFIGYVDILLKDKTTGDVIIIDLKTSTNGWSDYQKSDKVKTSQMLLYKQLYSDNNNFPIDKIKVEYQILKRKLYETNGYQNPRISKFVPANGKPSVKNAFESFKSFVSKVHDSEGNRRSDIEYPTNKGKQCDWCEFKERKICSVWV
jgi:hypothetical protein